MTPFVAKLAFVLLLVGWFVIRYPYARRARRSPVARSGRGVREMLLMSLSTLGLGVLPLLYVATGFPESADCTFRPAVAFAGVVVALSALVMFRLTHRALGQNWSISLDVRQRHTLVATGIYRRIRHPMYTAFWLWAFAQALLLPNLVGGLAGLVGFGTLFFGRVGREEEMMLETFGGEYRSYMDRTNRIIPFVY